MIVNIMNVITMTIVMDYDDRQLQEDTFYALTGGQYGDYHDGINMDDLMDGLGY